MAYAFATNQQITATTPAARNQSKFTFAGWIRRGSSGSFQGWGFLNSIWFGVIHFTDNVIYAPWSQGVGIARSATASAQNVTGWNHIVYTFDGTQSVNSDKVKIYLNGSSVTLAAGGPTITNTSNDVAIESFSIGRDSTLSWSTGDFAELGMWREALTAGEVNSLAKGFSPKKVRPQSLYTYIPLVREIQDIQKAITLTNTNATVAIHPRVYA